MVLTICVRKYDCSCERVYMHLRKSIVVCVYVCETKYELFLKGPLIVYNVKVLYIFLVFSSLLIIDSVRVCSRDVPITFFCPQV